MLTIICGEDSISSRSYFLSLKKDYANRETEIYDIKAIEINEINKWLSDSVSLFSKRIVFFTEKLNKAISKRSNPALFSLVEKLAKRRDVEIVDWEEYASGRELKISKGIVIKEFKLSQSIFKLLDSCYPKNLTQFVSILYSLPGKIDEIFIFIMLIRHIHNLFVIKHEGTVKSLQSWQVAKLKSQASYWSNERLESFYDGLYRIDVALKTGRNPFSLRKSLDLLACYFL